MRTQILRATAAAVALALFLGSCARAAGQGAAAVDGSTYTLRLEVDDSLSEIAGSLSLRYLNQEPAALERLQFFLFPNLTQGRMRVTRCAIAGSPARTESWMNGAVLTAALPRPLPPGARIEVDVDYRVTVPEDPAGEFGGFSRSGGTLSMAWCYPVVLSPRTWDSPAPVPWGDYLCKEPSIYSVRLSLPDGVELVAPGEERSRRKEAGRTVVEFTHGPARDLFMAILREPVTSTARVAGVQVRSFAPAGRQEAAALAADTATRALEIFGRRFGAYPYGSLTVVGVPLASFGLEFPGIVALSERIFDLDTTVSGLPARVLLEATAAHEVAHQWFYGIVGNDQAREPWLDEVPAQYVTWLYYRDRYGAAAAEGFFASFRDRWNRVAGKAIPIGLGVWDYDAREYGAIVYGRGPLFFKALSERMGETSFDRLLREWVRRYAGRIATTRDFSRLAGETCGCAVEDLFREWVLPAGNAATGGAPARIGARIPGDVWASR